MRAAGAKKMATVSQLNMLSAKARQAGVDFDRDAAKKFENGEVTELVKEFNEVIVANGQIPYGLKDEELEAVKAKIAAQRGGQQEAADPKPEPINNVRFGMACKLVIQKYELAWSLENPDKFIEKVKQLYELLNKAEVSISASSSCSAIKAAEAKETQPAEVHVFNVSTHLGKKQIPHTDINEIEVGGFGDKDGRLDTKDPTGQYTHHVYSVPNYELEEIKEWFTAHQEAKMPVIVVTGGV